MRRSLEAEMYFKADQESFQIPIVIAHEFQKLVSSDYSIASYNRLMNTSYQIHSSPVVSAFTPSDANIPLAKLAFVI